MNLREYRSVSERQGEFLDACFGVGDYADPKGNESRLRYVLGGGAGFGGKSHTIRTGIVEAAMRLSDGGVKTPRQLVVCKTMTDLQERQIAEISRDTHFPSGVLNGLTEEFGEMSRHVLGFWQFRFTGDYAHLGMVEFRHAQNLDRRRGAQYDCVWVDELTQFTRDDFDALLYMLRSVNSPFLLFAAVTNPDGPGNSWVRKLWVDKQFSDETLKERRFHFVPFTVHDNPAHNQEAIDMLMGQSEDKVRSRFYGEWDLMSGSRFRNYSATFNKFNWDEFSTHYAGEPGYDPGAILHTSGLFSFYGSLDYGTSADSASAYYIHAMDTDGYVWTFGELWMPGTSLPVQAKQILDHEGRILPQIRLCDPNLQGGDTFSGRNRIMSFMEEGLILHAADNSREEGWESMDYALYWEADPETGLLKRRPKWRIHEGCVEAHAFLRNAPCAPNKRGDVDPKFTRDHAGDSLRYGISYLITPPSDDEAMNKVRAALKAQRDALHEKDIFGYDDESDTNTLLDDIIPREHRAWR